MLGRSGLHIVTPLVQKIHLLHSWSLFRALVAALVLILTAVSGTIKIPYVHEGYFCLFSID